MARGAKGTSENLATQGVASSDQFNTNLTSTLQGQQAQLTPAINQLLTSPGYDPATKSAITNASEGAAAASFGGSADAASRAAARTGNSAALVPSLDKLAQQKASTMAGVAANDQVTFANDKQKQQLEGVQAASGLYGMNSQLLAKSLGLPVEYLQQYNNAGNAFKPPISLGFGPGGFSVGANV